MQVRQEQRKITLYQESQKGFTLAEMGIVLVLVGMILAGMTYAIQTWTAVEERESLESIMFDAEEGLAIFRAQMARYPCPADPDLDPTDPLYGVEDCSLTPVDGARDTEYDADLDPDPVLVGMFPTIAINNELMGDRPPSDSSVTQEQIQDFGINVMREATHYRTFSRGTRDPWGNPLIYAVTLTQTIPSGIDNDFDGIIDAGVDVDGDGNPDIGFDFEFGAIRIIDEEDRDTAGTNRNAHYVIVSRGEIDDCDSDFEIEYENCDMDDAVFRMALREANEESPNRYDDTLYHQFAVNDNMWAQNIDPDDPDADPDMVSTNQGKVVIGNEVNSSISEEVRLEVQGDIYAEQNTASSKYCDERNDEYAPDCLVPESFLTNIECENRGQYIKEVYYDEDGSLHVTCEDFAFLEYKKCSSGRYLKGVFSDGTPSCAKPEVIYED